MDVRLLPGVLSKDSYRDDAEEGTVLEFKRFKGKAQARQCEEADWEEFHVQLDLRARLFWVKAAEPNGQMAFQVGQAILCHAARFLMVPLSSLVAPLAPSPA